MIEKVVLVVANRWCLDNGFTVGKIYSAKLKFPDSFPHNHPHFWVENDFGIYLDVTECPYGYFEPLSINRKEKLKQIKDRIVSP